VDCVLNNCLVTDTMCILANCGAEVSAAGGAGITAAQDVANCGQAACAGCF
jgi:hypothetical protein